MRTLSARQQLLVLLFVLGGAFILRIWGIGYGLPYSYHNDEYHEVMRAFQLGAGSFNFGRIGKGGLYYLLFIEYGIYFVFLKLMGEVKSAAEFAAEFVRDPTAFYLMGRATVVVFGTLTVLLAFLIARRAYAGYAGVLAAVFLAVNVMHTDMSQKIVVDVPMVCFAAAALLMAVVLAEGGATRNYIWAAIFASLAATTKIPAIVLLVPLLVAHSYQVRQAGGGIQHWFASRQLWTAAFVFTAILVISNPGIVFAYQMLGLFTSGGASGAELLEHEAGAMLLDSERPNLFAFYWLALQSSMGLPLSILSILGVAYALWKRTPADIVLLSFAAVFYIAISSTTSNMYYARYVLPVVFVALIFAGRVLSDAWSKAGRLNIALLCLITAGFIAGPAYQSALNSYLNTQTDTRTLAKIWMEENIREGAKVLVEGAKISPVRNTVQLENTAENIQKLIAHFDVVEPRQADYLRLKLRVLEGNGFDLLLVPLSELEDLQSYREMGVEYFVVTPRFEVARKGIHGGALLAHELRNARDITLIKRIEADAGVRPGPTVEIFGYSEVQDWRE